jgi:SAM-dependent methyltransferase
MVRLATITSRQRGLDVGCGPGALSSALAGALDPENIAAIDPHEPFVKSCRERIPGADVRVGAAERLPFADHHFDVVLAQLVLNFVADPRRTVAEMRRVLRPGGVIAACVWDYPGEMTMLRVFWDAATALDPLRRSTRRKPTDALLPPRRAGPAVANRGHRARRGGRARGERPLPQLRHALAPIPSRRPSRGPLLRSARHSRPGRAAPRVPATTRLTHRPVLPQRTCMVRTRTQPSPRSPC